MNWACELNNNCYFNNMTDWCLCDFRWLRLIVSILFVCLCLRNILTYLLTYLTVECITVLIMSSLMVVRHHWTMLSFLTSSLTLLLSSTLCLKKVPTFKLSVTLSNLNRFSQCLHCWTAYEICYKSHSTLPTSP